MRHRHLASIEALVLMLAFIAFAVLWRWRVPEPGLVAAAGAVGLVLFALR